MTEAFRQQQQEASDELLRSQLAAVRACEEVSRKHFTFEDHRPHDDKFERMCQELADSKRANAELVAHRDRAIEVIRQALSQFDCNRDGEAIDTLKEYLKTI
jgi:hypothetical protein